MPGWIIQGVRGEGKSLAAVGKIKEYMLKGRPVATNLNLFLENLLPHDNSSIAYRLPDHPRLVDFQMLPPAYDPKYKREDMNGLLVLDELGTWLNARNWNDKNRLEMLNWLFLSRKDHWDLILLAQDYEMIDSQVRTTLCDFIVQASRLDRQKIPYLASTLRFFGLSGMMPRVHRYHVYYGMSFQTNPVETWTYTGKDFYYGYDTNQKFLNGMEPLCGTLVDMRATYSYVPVNYLTGHVFVQRLEKQIDDLKKHFQPKKTEENISMAKKGSATEQNYLKIGLLSVGLVVFIGYRIFSGGFKLPESTAAQSKPLTSVSAVSSNDSVKSLENNVDKTSVPDSFKDSPGAIEAVDFFDYLIQKFRPRLSISAYSPDTGFQGNIDFYENDQLVEQYSIKILHTLGVSVIHREYGADLVYKGRAYIVTAWKLPQIIQSEKIAQKTDSSKI